MTERNDPTNLPRFVDPFSDFGFKKLFLEPKNQDLLIHLINAVFESIGEPAIRSVQLVNMEHPGFDKTKKRVVQDLGRL